MFSGKTIFSSNDDLVAPGHGFELVEDCGVIAQILSSGKAKELFSNGEVLANTESALQVRALQGLVEHNLITFHDSRGKRFLLGAAEEKRPGIGEAGTGIFIIEEEGRNRDEG